MTNRWCVVGNKKKFFVVLYWWMCLTIGMSVHLHLHSLSGLVESQGPPRYIHVGVYSWVSINYHISPYMAMARL